MEQTETRQKFGIVLPLALLSYFLILMDNSIVFTSSTEIGQSLAMTAHQLTWVSNAYTLTFGSFLLLSGRLLDAWGRKVVFELGLIIFGVTSLVIGLSSNATLLIVMRALQGIGSSIIAPATLALMMDAYTGTMRRRAISYYGMTAGIGSMIGLVAGGAFTTLLSWRLGFIINVPLALILLLIANRKLTASAGKSESIDFVGAVISVIGLVSLIYGVGATSNQWWFIAAGVLLLVIFVVVEVKITAPVLPLELFANRTRVVGYIARLVFMMMMLSFWFLLPQYMSHQYGYSALENGLAFLPIAIFTVAGSMLGRRFENISNRGLAILGYAIISVGMLWLALANLHWGMWLSVAAPMVFLGVGQGLVMPALTNLGIYKAPQKIAGSASGMVNTVHQLGGPLGLSLIVAQTTTSGSAMWYMFAFSIVGLLVTMFAQAKD